ncbi:MAG: FAD:protein FMN transferase [Pirellulaceae bacterium]
MEDRLAAGVVGGKRLQRRPMTRRRWATFLGGGLALSVASPIDPASAVNRFLDGDQMAGYQMIFPSMGTQVTVHAYGDREETIRRAMEAVRQEVERLADLLTDYDDDSELSRLTHEDRVGQWSTVSHDLDQVVHVADWWHRTSGGLFDMGLGALTRLWRAARRKQQLPSAEAVANARRVSGWSHVEWDRTGHRFRFDQAGVRLDAGGIAKGYVVDRAFVVMESHGMRSCMINAGGNLRCGEAPPGRAGWRIQVASPLMRPVGSSTQGAGATRANQPGIQVEGEDQTEAGALRIEVANCSVATSGDLHQFLEVDGRRYSHILDPRTGWGMEGMHCATVICPLAIDADAMATVLCLQGGELGIGWAQKQHAQATIASVVKGEADQADGLDRRSTLGFPPGS